jgi:hypothetical protein
LNCSAEYNAAPLDAAGYRHRSTKRRVGAKRRIDGGHCVTRIVVRRGKHAQPNVESPLSLARKQRNECAENRRHCRVETPSVV